jgi:HK97 family phage major capsid protein
MDLPSSKSANEVDMLINFGGAVKAIGENEIEGYLVRFGSEDEPDASSMADFFTPDTYYGKRQGAGVDVTLNHGIPLKRGLEWAADALYGEIKSVTPDQFGLLARAIIDADEDYKRVVMQMVKEGRLKWSSGAVSHLVKRAPMKNGTNRIDQWIIGEAALTPTPAEPRLPAIIGIKSYFDLSQDQAAKEQDDPEAATPEAETTISAASDAVVNETKSAAEPPPILEDEDMDQELKDAMLSLATSQKALADGFAEMKAAWDAPADNGGAKLANKKNAAPDNGQHKTPLGDDPFKAFGWYLKTGDPSGIRTGEAYEDLTHEHNSMKTTYNLLESTQFQGQEAVPTEVVARIIEKRDQISVLRAAGAQVIPVGSNAVVLPIEKASPEVFVITTVDGTNTFDQTTVQPMDKLSGTIYLFTRSVPMDMQLLDDAVFGIEAWWSRRMARAWGLTENKYFLTGTGSGQPDSIIHAGGSAFTSASGLALTAAEIEKLYYNLAQEYRDNVSWAMSGASEATIRGLAAPTNGFAFVGNGGYNGGAGSGGGTSGRWLIDPTSRVYNGSDMASIGVNNKPVAVFNAEAGYVIFERKGLTIFRDPYTLANKGEVNILAYFRETGGVSNSDAVKFVTMASA